MSHLLFIQRENTIPPSLQEAFSSTAVRLVIRKSPDEAKSAIERDAFDTAVVYSQAGADKLSKSLIALRKMSPSLFIIVIAPEYDLMEEQVAFDQGADLYFAEPLPSQTLRRILIQNDTQSSPQSAASLSPVTDRPASATNNAPSALHILRDFSQVLGFSLDYKAFSQQFILKLRDYISFSRIGIFLETSAKQSLVKNGQSNHLECVASHGLPSDLIDCFQLSRDVGIGRSLHQYPRVLNLSGASNTPFENQDTSIRKEFKILGCHLAVPITDRERTIGVAVLNGPVTGRNYSEDELQLLYLLMEELGLAIRNSRLHAELARHGALIENVLSSMASGAIVVSEDLEILYANRAAKRFLDVNVDETRPIDFAELPTRLAMPVHKAVEKGEVLEPFHITGPNGEDIFRISIFPFSQKGELMLLPRPTMVILEDFTKIEAHKQNELEETKSELIGLIAERFAHEIRNSLVPLTTHMQLIDKKIDQPKFQTSLKSALQKETGRIKRFSEQMLYLAQNSNPSVSVVDLETVILGGFQSAKKHSGNQKVRLNLGDVPKDAKIEGDPEAMAYAFEELFLNSIQASEKEATPIRVGIQRNDEGILTLTIRDGGPGFAAEAIEEATTPFYTSRNTGVGLGLSVAKKIIETHKGFLKPNQRSEQADWDIKIELPSTLAHTLKNT